MNILTYVLIGIAVSALTAFLRKPKMPKGQTVAMPALIAVIGGFAILFFGALAVWACIDGSDRFALCVFAAFMLWGAALVMAYCNCRISYDETSFTVKNFWGITRTYTYKDITWRKGTKDVKLYVGERVVRIDEMAIGKTEFLCYAEARYMKTHGGRGIPTSPPNGKKAFDLFNGNVENSGELIIVYCMVLVFILGALGYIVFDSLPPKAEELSYSTIQVEYYEVEDDTLYLYAKGEKLPFDVWGYAVALEDVQTFLQLCDSGESITVGYRSATEHHILHYAEDAEGMVHLTMEAANRQDMENTKEVLLLMGGMALFWLLFIAASIYVGRHPNRFSPRIVWLFFNKESIRVNGPMEPLHKKR